MIFVIVAFRFLKPDVKYKFKCSVKRDLAPDSKPMNQNPKPNSHLSRHYSIIIYIILKNWSPATLEIPSLQNYMNSRTNLL